MEFQCSVNCWTDTIYSEISSFNGILIDEVIVFQADNPQDGQVSDMGGTKSPSCIELRNNWVTLYCRLLQVTPNDLHKWVVSIHELKIPSGCAVTLALNSSNTNRSGAFY